MDYDNQLGRDWQKEWQAALAETHKLRDGLGNRVDGEIVDTVTALRLIGVRTIMSCGGHLHRQTGGPYVMFQAEDVPLILGELKKLTKTRTLSVKDSPRRLSGSMSLKAKNFGPIWKPSIGIELYLMAKESLCVSLLLVI